MAAMPCMSALLAGNACAAATEGQPAMKTENVLANPSTALLSPNGGRLEVTQAVHTRKAGENSVFDFIIPGSASNLQISVPGHTIVRWDSVPAILQHSSVHATRRADIENERMHVAAQLLTVTARLAVWQAQPAQGGVQDMEQRQNLMRQQMPALAQEQETLQKRLDLLRQELADMPGMQDMGQRITVTLQGSDEHAVNISYSYDLGNCGWHAVYDFNAKPDNGAGEMIDVRLLAEIWQYTGMDWKGTKITLATLNNGPREPQPLPRWVVGAQPKPTPRAVTLNAKARTAGAPQAIAESAVAPSADAVPLAAPVMEYPDSVYATWILSARGLPEGKSRVQITTDTWKAPLEWLARPSMGDNRVWLMAKYNLSPDHVWPEGLAQYSVDGQNVGEGDFRPKGGEAVLYFGADPRVSVSTTIDSNKQGETGFINTSKTWTGAWTYTISNGHGRPIKVRVERPAPMVANDNITVTYKDTPQGTVNDKEHMVVWNVEVPAHGKTVIQHSVLISSPEKLPLLPDVP